MDKVYGAWKYILSSECVALFFYGASVGYGEAKASSGELHILVLPEGGEEISTFSSGHYALERYSGFHVEYGWRGQYVKTGRRFRRLLQKSRENSYKGLYIKHTKTQCPALRNISAIWFLFPGRGKLLWECGEGECIKEAFWSMHSWWINIE